MGKRDQPRAAIFNPFDRALQRFATLGSFRSMLKLLRALAPLCLILPLAAAGPLPTDADTRAWWATTAALSSDAMAGRDTGSAAYERAAELVARRFAAAGLKPAGDAGGFFQRVPMQELRVERATLSVGARPLRFLHDIVVNPVPGMRQRTDAPLAYRGYCDADILGDVRDKVVICHGTHRSGHPSDAARVAAVKAAGAAALVTIADPGFAVEPPRWPFAYACTVWLPSSPPNAAGPVRFTLNVNALARMLSGSGRDAAQLVTAGAAGAPLPSFDPPGRFRADLRLVQRAISAPNVLALLPGSDPALSRQTVVRPRISTATVPVNLSGETASTTERWTMPPTSPC